MAYGKNIAIDGIDVTIRNLIKYNEAFYQQAIKIAENAAKIVENAGKQDAPVGKTGNLRKSIKRKKVDVDRVAYTVMPRFARGGRHRHLVAYGTGPRSHKKTGKNVGAMPANDYMSGAEAAAKPYFESSMRAEAERNVYI
ncbi:MAG: HK97 gp10 family phage protein [Eubacteriales bacterium]